MIKNILMDLDDTILDFKRAEKTAITKTLLRLRIDPNEDTLALYHDINAGLWRSLEDGRIERRALLTERFRRLFEILGVEGDPHATQQMYEEYLSMGNFFVDGARELLPILSERYTLYIASNGNVRVQDKRILNTGLMEFFADRFLSEQIGFDKPHVAFFNACFARMTGADRTNTVMVGDSINSDMRGGMNAGIPTVWYNPDGRTLPEGVRVHAVIRHLRELPDVLESL